MKTMMAGTATVALILLALAAPVAGAQEEGRRSGRIAGTPLPGMKGEERPLVRRALLVGGDDLVDRDDDRPLSGSVRLGSIVAPAGSILLVGSFHSGQLLDVSARQGRNTVSATKLVPVVATGLDDWRKEQPTVLSSSGPGRGCGIETATLEVPEQAAKEAGLGPGTYAVVSWVCRFQTMERWAFRIPPRQMSAEAPPTS